MKLICIFLIILSILGSMGQRFPFRFRNSGFFRPPGSQSSPSQLGGCRGQSWFDGCNNCVCANGVPACTRRFCFN